MNKYFRASITVPFGIIKMAFAKLFHPINFQGTLFCMASPYAEITIDKNAKLSIGRIFKMRDGAKIRVRKGAECHIGNNVAIGSHSMIVCHDYISIGNSVQLSPNVQIYDHDHDFRIEGGINQKKFLTSSVEIGDNVWIGANVVILRGTKIGTDSVVGAGCVLKGEYPANSVIIQKRSTEIIKY